MTPAEMARLLGFASTFDGRKVTDETVQAWLLVVGDIGMDVAVEAVRTHYKTQTRWVMPADIVAHDRAVRAARADAAASAAIRAGHTDTSALWRAVFRGQPFALPAPPPKASGPPPEMLARRARRRAVLAIACPVDWCRAEIGQACRTQQRPPRPDGTLPRRETLTNFHAGREEAAGVRNPTPDGAVGVNPHYDPAAAAQPPETGQPAGGQSNPDPQPEPAVDVGPKQP
jgi:hypothetical protein